MKVGDNVQVGDVLRKIGLSGRTQFPHVHVSVRHNGTRIDPFAPSGRLTCNASADTLWETPLEYNAGGLLSLRFLTTCRKLKRCALVAKLHHLQTKVPQSSSPPLDLVCKKAIS